MKYGLIFILLTTLSCSSLKKTLIYSGLSGGITGAIGGAALSPNIESRRANAAVFGLVGAIIAASAGYALYRDDPRNYKLKNMLMDEKPADPNLVKLDLDGLNLNANLNQQEMYQVPLKKLPNELKGKVDKQYLIKYQSKERYIKKGNKTFYIPSFYIYQHAYGENYHGEINQATRDSAISWTQLWIYYQSF